MKKWASVLVIMFLVGCASSQPKGAIFSAHTFIPEDKSVIYFYVADEEPGSNSCIIVTIDTEEHGCVGMPGYLKVSVNAGEHFFSFRPKALVDLGVEMRKFSYSTEAGKAYYLESKIIKSKEDIENALQTNYVNSLVGHTIGWVLVEEQEALRKLTSLRQWQ